MQTQKEQHKRNSFFKDQRGVFGLTSVQMFFAIILSVALLAYVVVVVMSTLNTSSIITTTESVSIRNETGYINGSGYTLAGASNAGFINPSITFAVNATVGNVPTNNYTVNSAGLVQNTSAVTWNLVNFTYTYSRFTTSGIQVNGILSNTSSGVTSFFTNINPVYAILAILVIILILVVLVRVVTGKYTGGGSGSPPAL